jgi:hypothetical protein
MEKKYKISIGTTKESIIILQLYLQIQYDHEEIVEIEKFGGKNFIEEMTIQFDLSNYERFSWIQSLQVMD